MSKVISKEVQQFIRQNLSEEYFRNNVPNQVSAFIILDITASVNGIDEAVYKRLTRDEKEKWKSNI